MEVTLHHRHKCLMYELNRHYFSIQVIVSFEEKRMGKNKITFQMLSENYVVVLELLEGLRGYDSKQIA